ncbi:MAG: hypothetical protein ABSB19_12020 [Methylomonas sp.]|jgi:hypothetical protein
MRILTNQIGSINSLLSSSIDLYFASFSRLQGLIGIQAGLQILIFFLPVSPVAGNGQPAAEDFNLFVLMLIIMGSLVSFLVSIGMVYRLDNFVNEREDSLPEALSAALGKLPIVLLTSIAYVLVSAAGLLLLIVPGVVLSGSLMFFMYFNLLESKGCIDSLKASHQLVWGNWWRTMTIQCVFPFAFILLLIPLYIIGITFQFNIDTLQNIVNMLSIFFTPLMLSLGYTVYRDLKLRQSAAGNDDAGLAA